MQNSWICRAMINIRQFLLVNIDQTTHMYEQAWIKSFLRKNNSCHACISSFHTTDVYPRRKKKLIDLGLFSLALMPLHLLLPEYKDPEQVPSKVSTNPHHHDIKWYIKMILIIQVVFVVKPSDSSDLHDPSLKVANPLSPQCVCRLSVSRTILSTVVFPF